ARRRLADLVVLAPLAVCAAVGAHVLFTAAVWGAARLLDSDDDEVEEVVAVAVIEEPEPPPEPEPAPEPEPEPEPEAEPPPPRRPPAPEPPPPGRPRRLVGLDRGSPVGGGSGPSFAPGTGLRGQTGSTAHDPAQASREPEPPKPAQRGRNRAATRIPGDGVKLVKPRRLGDVRPDYPPELRAQGIEGNVVVQVRLDRAGSVVEATVVSPAPYPEMNAAAL